MPNINTTKSMRSQTRTGYPVHNAAPPAEMPEPDPVANPAPDVPEEDEIDERAGNDTPQSNQPGEPEE